MNTVQPIREMVVVEGIQHYLKQRNERNFVMFCLGIYTGLRISDILNLQVRDVRDKDHIYLREIKTGKLKSLAINPELKRILKPYIKDKENHEFLVPSRKGKNKPINREQAYRILKEVAEHFDLERIGTHTLRKTFGYHFHKMTNNSEMLREIFNHADVSITRKYIGIEQDTIDQAISKMKFSSR
ncbi:site-specific integrase [Paenibacillus sp. SI8]|uniref:site-specific integrase n=1 Tax=unclassified Paenibacillus TaxID=185978 RepID=UPI003466D0FD